MIVVGGVYQLRKNIKLKPETGLGGERWTVLNKSLVTVVDCKQVGESQTND